MSVSVIKITEPIGVNKKNNRNTNIYATSATGGAAGIVLRHVLPVGQNEMDTVLFNSTDKIKENNIRQVKKSILSELKDALIKDQSNEALVLFNSRIHAMVLNENALIKENKPLLNVASTYAHNIKQKIKESPEAVQKEIKQLTQKVINRVKAERVLTEGTIKASVKQQRPIAAFLLPGVALGSLAGFVYNVVGAISED